VIILFHNLLIFISFYFYHLFYHLKLPLKGNKNLLLKSITYLYFLNTYHLITFFQPTYQSLRYLTSHNFKQQNAPNCNNDW